MNSPSPCSYHQNDTAVATSSASRAFAMRLRNSVRWATSVIVRSGSRGVRRRRPRSPPGAWLTVVLLGGGESAGAVGRARLLGVAGLLAQPGGQVTVGRGGHDLAPQRRGPGGVLGPDVRTGVVVLHALHLALEDPQRAAERARGVRELLVAEEQQDGQDDQADLQRAEVHWS